jgi:hypothetical protein
MDLSNYFCNEQIFWYIKKTLIKTSKEALRESVIAMVRLGVALVVLLLVLGSHQHGMLLDPVNRSSMWRNGYNVPANYEDNQLFCGGRAVSLYWLVSNV